MVTCRLPTTEAVTYRLQTTENAWRGVNKIMYRQDAQVTAAKIWARFNVGIVVNMVITETTAPNLQSWTKRVGTLVHNSFFFFFFRYSISILPSPPFNVVLLWTRRANFIAYHVWLQHWFRGVGSVKCPSINGQDCRHDGETAETYNRPENF